MNNTIPTPAKYVADFENLGFGMFVHWGLYSLLGHGEWNFFIEKWDMKEYKKLIDKFTAEDFDAEKLVLMAKNAGCKYVVLTTRHHEGFSLYDTCGLNEFDAVHSPAKRDLVREFVDACNKYDIVPFLYHTTLDWYVEEYKTDFKAYQKYLQKSIEILCTNYGKIGGFWFDGNWDKPDEDWEEDILYGIIRKYQPEAIIVNNTGIWERGVVGHPEIDSVTYERGRPEPMDRRGMSKYIAAEMNDIMNRHWGVATQDFHYKSINELIESFCECRKVGANYLLNVSPTATGGILTIQEEFLKIIGKWVDLYKEAIYVTKPYNTQKGRNFILKGDKCLYLFFFNHPEIGNEHVTINDGTGNDKNFVNVEDKVLSIEWLDNKEQLKFEQNGTNMFVDATMYPYGMSTCVRVAKAVIE